MEIEQYRNNIENFPRVHVGPQHYFRTLPWTKPKRKKLDDDDEERNDDDEEKKKIVPREKTDKFVYKPMRKTVY